jgi:hypothetical protein
MVVIISETTKMSQGRHTHFCQFWLCHLQSMYSLVTAGIKIIAINTLCGAIRIREGLAAIHCGHAKAGPVLVKFQAGLGRM